MSSGTVNGLSVSERLALDHIKAVVTAVTLTVEMPAASAKSLRDHARAVDLYVRCREYRRALDTLAAIREAASTIEGADPIERVFDRSEAALRRWL